MTITYDYFTTMCPEFLYVEDSDGNLDEDNSGNTPLPESVFTSYLEVALCYTGDTYSGWGTTNRWEKAQVYCLAHLLTKYYVVQNSEDAANQSPKVVTGQSVGDVSISWGGANLIPSDYTADFFNTTVYGYMYLNLREQKPRRRMVAVYR